MSAQEVMVWIGGAALRSCVVAAMIAVILGIFRVKDARTRLSAWTVALLASLAMPVLIPLAPRIRIPVPPSTAVQVLRVPAEIVVPSAQLEIPHPPEQTRIEWTAVLTALYLATSLGLLIRLLTGLYRTRAISRSAEPVASADLPVLMDLAESGNPPRVISSDRIVVPVTFGWRRPVIVLPAGWQRWPGAKLKAVLAHELSHIARRDYLRRILAKINTVLFPLNPLSWFLERTLAELSEQVSDDDGVQALHDPAAYAAVVLGFLRDLKASRLEVEGGVAMARISTGTKRVERILDSDGRAVATTRFKRNALLAMLIPVVALAAGCGLSERQGTTGRLVEAAFAQVQEATVGRDGSYVYVHDNGATMSGTHWDRRKAIAYRSRYGDEYLWFRKGGKEYIVTDGHVLAQIKAALRPSEELGLKQAELGHRQAKLGEEQSRVGERHADAAVELPDLMADIERLRERAARLKGRKARQSEIGELQAEIGELQAKIGGIQARIGDVHSEIGALQEEIGKRQEALGKEQELIGREQEKASREMERVLYEIINSTIRSGAAKEP